MKPVEKKENEKLNKFQQAAIESLEDVKGGRIDMAGPFSESLSNIEDNG